VKKRLRKKLARKRSEARLVESIKQMERAINVDFSHVTVHTLELELNKKAPR
jgi:hypothetical protein